MPEPSKAFSESIPSGLIRILLRVESLICEYENDAPEFVDPREDRPALKIVPETDVSGLTDAFEKSYALMLNSRKTKEGFICWEMEQGGIWFDISMDDVKEIWLSEFNFYIQSQKPRYLSYHIKNVDHKVEWLQVDDKTGEIRSLSEFKKKFTPPPVSGKESFRGSDVIKCADMIGRASQRIDLRTRTALVKFNTDKGRLESLIIGMAEKLGYHVEALDKETIRKEDEKGNSVSHLISLK